MVLLIYQHAKKDDAHAKRYIQILNGAQLNQLIKLLQVLKKTRPKEIS